MQQEGGENSSSPPNTLPGRFRRGLGTTYLSFGLEISFTKRVSLCLRGWEDGLVSEVLALQAQGPVFSP